MRIQYFHVVALLITVAIGSCKQSELKRSSSVVQESQDITYIKAHFWSGWVAPFKANLPAEAVVALREGNTFSLQLMINHSMASDPKTVDGYTEIVLPLTAEEWGALVEVAKEDLLNWVPPRWPEGIVVYDTPSPRFSLGGEGWMCEFVDEWGASRPLWNLMGEYATKADSLTLRFIRPVHGEYERREELSIQDHLADELHSISVFSSKVVPDSSGMVRLTENLVVFNSPGSEERNLIVLAKHSTAGWASSGKEAPISYQDWLSLVEIVEQEGLLTWLPDASEGLPRSDSLRLGYMLRVRGSGRGASIERHFDNAASMIRLHQRMLELAEGKITMETPLLDQVLD